MKKFEIFCKSLKNLQEIESYNEPFNNVVRTGFVALYGICFEQSWKAMKEILEEQGYSEENLSSPRKVLQVAYKENLITDEKLWIEAMNDRKNIEYAFDERVASDILEKVKNVYVKMFETFRSTVKKD